MPRFTLATLPRAAIRIAEDAAAPLRFAADELQRYLQRMTDGRIPVVEVASLRGREVIVLGAVNALTAATQPLGGGRFAIVPDTERITLHGDSPRALLSATYALLAQLGCRWSLHGPQEETVPRLTAGEIELTPVERAPVFEVHGYCSDIMTWHYTQPEYFHDRLGDDRAFIDWMGKSGANAFFFIRHPFDTQLTIPELLPDFQQRGIDVEYGGHVMPLLLPRTTYHEHPEYFPQLPDGARTEYGNLCTSNASALALAAAHAVQYVHEYPEMHVIHIWGADLWHGGWCHCSACRGVSVQDQSLRVCNAVARGLAEAGVARPVCYLAYHDTIEADLHLPPEPNVIVEFAPRERCYGHALNDASCPTNRRYAAALERYVELFDGRVRLFEYYGDAILFFGCAVPLTQVIAADLAYYRRLGVPGITMLQFGTFSQWAYPLNFLAFAAGEGDRAAACGTYGARFGTHAPTGAALFARLEATMRQVVTYGDIRRPPRAPETAAQVLRQVEAALPQLADVVCALERLDGDAVNAQAALMRYTQMVLEGVRRQLQMTVAGEAGVPERQYVEALHVLDAVERRFKGLWGSVDLAIIHSYYTAAVGTDPVDS